MANWVSAIEIIKIVKMPKIITSTGYGNIIRIYL